MVCTCIKINNLNKIDSRGYDRSLIASRSIESCVIQILKTGFFHADPHLGNLAIGVDGSLIYYDFGMMGEIKSFTWKRLLDLFYAVYEKDAKKVMGSLINLGSLQLTNWRYDIGKKRRSIEFFLDNLLGQTPDQQQTLAAIGETTCLPTVESHRRASPFGMMIIAISFTRSESVLAFQEVSLRLSLPN
ncbi:putative aarF domain-containing protein kinase [Acorus calamus]|uniref:AarF domain-containing protein kinase n=1 Tax=Acorus calamus TaxID=4465 RepID=A0AAV9D5M5_ACOCL|nr:putative aarF domain-containing protein kinase [Acorus calamus]